MVSGIAIFSYSQDGKRTLAADGFMPRDFVIGHNGLLYATEGAAGASPSNVWLIRPDGTKEIVDTGLRSPTGITLSPDQSLLYVADGASHWIYSYRVQSNGTLADKQRYYWLLSSDVDDESHAGRNVLRQSPVGSNIVATDLGIFRCATRLDA